jgi:uncharacterized membrane protein YgcG
MLKQFAKSVLCLLIVVWTVLAASSSSFAQLSPPISPWMGMVDRSREPGMLDNYNRLVKPQQDMLKAYVAQENQLKAQQRALQSMQSGSGSSGGGTTGSRDLSGSGSSGGGIAGGNILLHPPREIPSAQRNPAGFYQYLHYYPANGLPRQPVPNFSSVGRRR